MAHTTTTPAWPPRSGICFAKPEGDSQCEERAKKRPETARRDTAGSVGVIHRPVGRGRRRHRRAAAGRRTWARASARRPWAQERGIRCKTGAAGAAAFPRARLMPPAGLQPGDTRLRMGMTVVAQATPQGIRLAPDVPQIGALEHSWGHHIPQGADLRGHLLKILPQTPGKAVAAAAACTTGPPDCCCRAVWCWTKAGANRSLRQPHATLGPTERWRQRQRRDEGVLVTSVGQAVGLEGAQRQTSEPSTGALGEVGGDAGDG